MGSKPMSINKSKTIQPLISALSVFEITRIGRNHRLDLIEDEFKYASPFGEPFTFVLIHNDTPDWFAKDFRALLNTIAFKPTEYEQDIRRILTEACATVEEIVKGIQES